MTSLVFYINECQQTLFYGAYLPGTYFDVYLANETSDKVGPNQDMNCIMNRINGIKQIVIKMIKKNTQRQMTPIVI